MIPFPGRDASPASHYPNLVRDIAARSVSVVRSRLRADVATMSAAELRGYVRARAHAPVRELAAQIAARYNWRGAVPDDLITRSIERTVQFIVRQAMLQPIPCAPSVPEAARRTG